MERVALLVAGATKVELGKTVSNVDIPLGTVEAILLEALTIEI